MTIPFLGRMKNVVDPLRVLRGNGTSQTAYFDYISERCKSALEGTKEEK